ncbi:PLP-dependent transferase [Meira miltonrushii]|uniref:PLP-dependent transferase n=1 Tax=Meira miltonrushii TaxID=1280837 RepID=A0A316V4Z7_9BASI|nr:PLP-dependent transferase [Meira miltonrushii]PWN32098.1 PLP-dependent transferase [Meira miltonrushii]
MAPPLSHLYPQLRIHQIFGANTDVGKTIFTTALALASAALPIGSKNGKIERDKQGSLNIKEDGEAVHYIKPISTGPLRDSDSLHIARYLPSVNAHTLFQFNDPVSPHVAAARFKAQDQSQQNLDVSDEAVVHALSNKISSFTQAALRPAAAYIETAGGVHSPAPSGSSISQLLRPLRMPTILIGDSNLGGISTTKSAYDSLLMAGYDIEALLLFSDAGRGWGNADYLTKWGQEIGLPVWALSGPSSSSVWGLPPAREGSDEEDARRMQEYYAGLVAGRGEAAESDESSLGAAPIIEHLRNKHEKRLRDIGSLAKRTRDTCWWPFTQHMLAKSDKDVNVIDSAYGDFFTVLNQSSEDASAHGSASLLRPLLDGSASWWTQCLGHADPGLTRAAARAAGRYGHVLFPMCANEPSLQLSETLVGKNPSDVIGTSPGAGWASRVFFSDDGSTGMEVALKMAISSAASRYAPRAESQLAKDKVQQGRLPGNQSGRPPREWMVLGLKGSYHGDTIGAMDACEGNIFNEKVEWYRGRGSWFEPPTVSIKDGQAIVELPLHDSDWQRLSSKVAAKKDFKSVSDIYNVSDRMNSDELKNIYSDLIYGWLDHLTRMEGNRYGALILEPLIMGAGGMICVDPLFQRCFVDVIRANPDLFSQLDPPLRGTSHIRESDVPESGNWKGLPIIFDEVFTGLYRLGYSTPAQAIGVNPDISVLAKILTGGMVPMSVTLASDSIFSTFAKSDQKIDALLHGHSYTAHPIGCEIANEALRRIEKMQIDNVWADAKADWRTSTSTSREDDKAPSPWSLWSREAIETFSKSANVESAMALGTVMILNLSDNAGEKGYSSSAAVDILQHLRTTQDTGLGKHVSFNIHARPLGNVVYVMCSLNTPTDVLRETESALKHVLKV